MPKLSDKESPSFSNCTVWSNNDKFAIFMRKRKNRLLRKKLIFIKRLVLTEMKALLKMTVWKHFFVFSL